MADAVEAPRTQRRIVARSRRRRDDFWVGSTALIAALLALPLAQSTWHGPEVASTLAVAAVALLARQRWAIAVIFIAQLLLLPTIWPRAFFGGIELWPGRIAAMGSLLLVVPGLVSGRRAAAAMVLLTGWRRTKQTCRRFQYGFAILGLIAALLPLF